MKCNERSQRRSLNVISFAITCLILFVAVHFSDGRGQLATKINNIAENLDKAVLRLSDNVIYSNYCDKSVYVSSVKFNAAGMAGLYNLTNSFIDTFAPANIVMDGLFILNKQGISYNNNLEVSDVLYYYKTLLAIIVFLVICVVLFPFCGLCFCCCRCCGNCGARPQPSDKKKDTCKKVIYGALLIMCGTGLLFCVVCAFVSNQQLQTGIEEFPTNMNNSVTDTKTFMDSTNNQLHFLLRTNYREFTASFTNLLQDGSDIAMDKLVQFAEATTFSEIYDFARNLSNINRTLYTLRGDTNRLRVLASQLNDAIRKVKRDLSQTLNSCPVHLTKCNQMKAKVNMLQTSIDFNMIPDLSETINSLEHINITTIQEGINEGQENFENIKNQINETLQKAIKKAGEQIDNAETIINDNLNSITSTVMQIKSQIDTNASPTIRTAQHYINDYGKYRYIVGLAVSCVLLLVVVCIILGLVCGVCGKRPDGYSDNCCNKGAGSQFLICGVLLMFLLGFLIAVFTIVSLTVGVVSEKAICDPIRNPDPEQYTVIKLLDGLNLDLNVDLKPSTILRNCYQNKTVYRTFGLESTFDIADIKRRFNVSDALGELRFETPPNIHLIGEGTFKELEKFEPDINVERFKDELQINLTNYNLDELSNGLRAIIEELTELDEQNLKAELELSLLHVNTYDEKLVAPTKELSKNIVETAVNLENQLSMGHPSFQDAIKKLRQDVTRVEEALQNNTKLVETADYYKNLLLNVVNGYVDLVTDSVENEIGRCGPLNVVINATLTSTCEKVLLPWNGFWFSLFGTMILYVLTIVISVKLANLYQKHKPYDQYVETEYLYDAYADRGDNIPLNSRGGKRGRKKGKKTKRYEERSNMGREYAPSAQPTDARYADMAPKHWEDFPNGGPPHYQRAPTEYERPPPYYYPGSGGEQ